MAELKMPVRRQVSYDNDFHAWTNDQATRLRRDRPATIDWENLAEEVQSLGRSDKRALGSGLKVILEQLIKWRYQPEKRSESWSDSIEEHRDRIARIIADSPSLAGWPAEIMAAEYSRARRKVLKDTKLPPSAIPVKSPFAVEQVLDPDYLPGWAGRPAFMPQPLSTPAGYSAKSLPDKLGYKPGQVAAFIALPPELEAVAGSVAFAEVMRLPSWTPKGKVRFDLIHAFTVSHAEIKASLPLLQAALKRDGMIWVSWPKKAAKVRTDVTEDVVRAEALKLDLVDVKVAAVDAIWSGLKLVIRKDRR